jgi:hypothetical protein
LIPKEGTYQNILASVDGRRVKVRVEKVLTFAFLNLFSTQIFFPSKLGIANSRDPKAI